MGDRLGHLLRYVQVTGAHTGLDLNGFLRPF